MAFRTELEKLINSYSMENSSNTPDFILAHYLVSCLAAFDAATRQREAWYGRVTTSLSLNKVIATAKQNQRSK